MATIETHKKEDYQTIIPELKSQRSYNEEARNRPLLTTEGFKVITLPRLSFQRLISDYKRTKNPGNLMRENKNAFIRGESLLGEQGEYSRLAGEGLRSIFEGWTGFPLIHSHIFGPRIYKRGSYLLNHADRLPLWISGTLTLEKSSPEPWIITIEKQGYIFEVDLEPGEMLLYEGLSCVHSRPYPLPYEYYVNIYFHYYPKSMKDELYENENITPVKSPY